jgi:glutathione S-transferase
MTAPTLFYCPGHLSFAPHVALYEIGKPFEAVHVSIKDGGTQSPAFRRLNPKGKVPVLDTGQEILTESAAILCYLALSCPESRLLPQSPLGVARAVEWTNWLSGVLTSVISQSFHPQRFAEDPQSHPGIRQRGVEGIRSAYAQIESLLQPQPWALAEGYSIVDPVLAIFFRWGHLVPLDMRQFTHWNTHTRRMEQRPAVQAALRSESISLWQ